MAGHGRARLVCAWHAGACQGKAWPGQGNAQKMEGRFSPMDGLVVVYVVLATIAGEEFLSMRNFATPMECLGFAKGWEDRQHLAGNTDIKADCRAVPMPKELAPDFKDDEAPGVEQ